MGHVLALLLASLPGGMMILLFANRAHVRSLLDFAVAAAWLGCFGTVLLHRSLSRTIARLCIREQSDPSWGTAWAVLISLSCGLLCLFLEAMVACADLFGHMC